MGRELATGGANAAGGYTFVRQAGEFVASLLGASRFGTVR